MASVVAISKSANKRVEKYFKDPENIKIGKTKQITSLDNKFITVLNFISMATFSKFVLRRHKVLNHYFPHTSPGSGLESLRNRSLTI